MGVSCQNVVPTSNMKNISIVGLIERIRTIGSNNINNKDTSNLIIFFNFASGAHVPWVVY